MAYDFLADLAEELNMQKGPRRALFVLKPKSLGQPGLTASKPCPTDSDLYYANLFHGGIAMPNSDLLPLLIKINRNQLSLEAAIMELTLWIEKSGADEVGV